jgi:hypothetical protein
VKTQLTCPKCKYEFHYDNGYYDDNIARLGIEVKTIIDQLAQHNLKTKVEQYTNTDWWLRAKKALTEKQKELSELKAFRKIADQQRHIHEFEAFKNAVKEICGDKIYKQCFDIMKKNTEAYSITDTAKVEYTRAKGKGIISINKL